MSLLEIQVATSKLENKRLRNKLATYPREAWTLRELLTEPTLREIEKLTLVLPLIPEQKICWDLGFWCLDEILRYDTDPRIVHLLALKRASFISDVPRAKLARAISAVKKAREEFKEAEKFMLAAACAAAVHLAACVLGSDAAYYAAWWTFNLYSFSGEVSGQLVKLLERHEK